MNRETTAGESHAGLIFSVLLIAILVASQRNYAKAHDSGIEQPIGYFGIAEYLFRHPEKLLRL